MTFCGCEVVDTRETGYAEDGYPDDVIVVETDVISWPDAVGPVGRCSMKLARLGGVPSEDDPSETACFIAFEILECIKNRSSVTADELQQTAEEVRAESRLPPVGASWQGRV